MSNPFLSRVGGVLSADIAVPEHDRVSRFYSRVLGTGESPLWRDDLMNNMGLPVVGLGKQSPDYASLPLQWMPHIQVADVAASVQRALTLGGTELMHGKADDGSSLWAVLRDPSGAAFGLIPLVPTEAMPASDAVPPQVGSIAWLDLTVPSAETIRDFYREVIGWTVEDVTMNDEGSTYADYSMLAADGAPVAGVCHARGANTGLPPVWLIYLPVGDVEESMRRVEAEGGTIVRVTRGSDGACVYCVVQDPVGVYFAIAPG